jgi:DNA-binding transcriptional ArsR family regulator
MKIRELDRFRWRLHDPASLALLTALSACEQADFQFLRRITGLAEGSLSSPLSQFERAGLVQIERRFLENRALVRLSDEGRQMFELYRAEDGSEAPRESRRLAAAERDAGGFPEPGAAEGKATQFSGFTVYPGGRGNSGRKVR